MLIFRSEEHVERWCAARDLSRGALLSPETAWQLAQAWYGDRLAPDWRRPTLDEIESLFRSLGLVEPFWHLR